MTALKPAPVLKRHKATGHAYARFNGHQIWFGSFDDAETHSRFATFVARWEANGRSLPEESGGEKGLTVEDLVAPYIRHAEVYYRRLDGSQTHEIVNVKYTVRPLLDLFRELPVAEFDLRALKRVREKMIDSGLSRLTVNNRVCRVVRIFGWGAEEEIVPPEVYGFLRALRPLKKGRSRAHETDPIAPVAWNEVEAVLGRVSAPVSAMILIQWFTGMRPGEIVQLRTADLDRSGEVWLYSPRKHKTAHHGRERVIAIGPQAQKVLSPFLLRIPRPAPEKPLFSPREAMAHRHARAREERQTPLWPSHKRAQARKRRPVPKTKPQDAYTVDSYRRAITRACKTAGVDSWSPNQLRHAAATRIRKEHGLEAARVVLGHASSAITEVYAELDQCKALEVMAQLG